jgi:hypothetical protein
LKLSNIGNDDLSLPKGNTFPYPSFTMDMAPRTALAFTTPKWSK